MPKPTPRWNRSHPECREQRGWAFEDSESERCVIPVAGAAGAADRRAGADSREGEKARFGRGEHGGLPAPVRMSAQKDSSRRQPAHGRERCSKTLLVMLRASSWRRTMGSQLAEGEIAAKDSEPHRAEAISKRNQQRSIAVCSSAVCQHDTFTVCGGGAVQEAANRRIPGGKIHKFFSATHSESIMTASGESVSAFLEEAMKFSRSDVSPGRGRFQHWSRC